MAPTHAHTYLPVAPERLTSQAESLSATAHETLVSPRFLCPCVTREIRPSLHVSVHRVQPVAAAKADIREAEERTKRENPTRESNE